MPTTPTSSAPPPRPLVTTAKTPPTSNTSAVKTSTASAASSSAQPSRSPPTPVDTLDTSKPASQAVPDKGVFKSQEDIAQLNKRRSTLFKTRDKAPPADLALVGKGASSAYQLSAMGENADHSKTTVIGKKDAWNSDVRGDGFINHEPQQLEHWDKEAPAFSEAYTERQTFVDANQRVFDKAKANGAQMVNDEVASVKQREDGLVEMTVRGGGSPIVARKAVLGTGAGPHYGFGGERGPKPAEGLSAQQMEQLKSKVVDLDEYMRQVPRTDGMKASLDHREPSTGKTVVVHGPNAGIDAVQRAWQNGDNVVWLSGKTDPVFLAGNRLPIQGVFDQHKDDANGPLHFAKIGRARPTVTPEGDGVKVTYTPMGSKTPTTIHASRYVMALGQDGLAEGAIGDVLKKGGIGADQLEPIYDVNQRFGQTYQTALGLQTKGTNQQQGVQVVGAAAASLAAAYEAQGTPIKNNYLEQYPVSDNATPAEGRHAHSAQRYLENIPVSQLLEHSVNPNAVPKNMSPQFVEQLRQQGAATPERPATTVLPSVVVSPQLGGVRPTTAARVGSVPEHIAQKANFSSDDRTMLAVHMAQKYPNLTSADTAQFINEIMDTRAGKTNEGKGSVLGFTPEATRQLEERLEATNRMRGQ